MKKILVMIGIIVVLVLIIIGHSYYKSERIDTLFDEGYEKLENKEYKAAIKDFDETLSEFYSSFFSFNRNYTKSVGIVYAQRGWCYKQLNKYEAALKDFNKAEELGFNKADLYENRGYVYEVLWDFEASFLDYKKFIELEPKNPLGYWKASGALMQQEKYDESILYLNKTIELDPENIMAYFHVGHVNLYGYKDFTKAKEYYTKAIEFSKEQNKEYNYLYYFKGKANKELNKSEESNIDFQKAIEIKPEKDVYGSYFRGLSYYNLENYAAAVPDFEKAIEIDPNYKYSYESLGDAYKGLKQNEKAVEYYNKYLSLIKDEDDIAEVKEKLKEMGYESE